jgi:hypothetical protein
MISEERKQWIQERELRAYGRYYWKLWLWVAVELACAGLFVYVIVIRK